MSNYNFVSTLDGLNNINADDVNSDNIVTDYLTVNINSSVPLITPHTANTNQIASCAFVQNAFSNNLLNYALLNPPTLQTFTGTNVFGVLQANTSTIATNSTRVATTAYVKSNLLNYGLLNPTTQTFTGLNNFPTQLTSDNSTLSATTAYVKSNLLNYGLLNPLTIQTWGNITTPIDNRWYGNTFSYASIESVNGFYVKSVPGPTASTYASINSLGNISTTSTIDSIGIISSDTGFNIPRISPLTTINNNGTISQTSTGTNSLFNTTFTGTSNQINIKAFVNTGPSTISQNEGTLTISAVTNNVTPRTSLILATRNLSNGGCVLFNGNSTSLNIGTNTVTLNLQAITTTNISSPTFNVTSTTVNLTGNNSFTATQATIGGTSVPKITIQPAIGSNTNEIASTKFVKDQLYITATALIGYAQLAATQIFTGINTFAQGAGNVIFNGGTLYNDTVGGASSSFMTQSGSVCTIGNNHDLGSVTLSTRTNLGVPRDNVYAINGNQAGLRGNSNNTIDITGTQATIGGTSVPLITTQPNSITSNNNEIASTKFVRDQAYITASSLTPYALLTANQTFTGTQTCVAANNVLPIKIKTQLTGYTGFSGGSLITDSGAFNGINDPGNYSVIAFGTAINTGGVLTLTTHSSTNCGIKITNSSITQTAPFNCGFYQIGAPVTTKTNYDLGYSNTITGASFTGTAWATSSGPYNIMSIVWNGSNNYTLGVWQVDIYIVTQNTASPLISFCWNTISNTSMALTEHCGSATDSGAYAGTIYSIFRMSFVLHITNLLGSYWLNCSRVGGSSLVSNTTYSYIKFTRIA